MLGLTVLTKANLLLFVPFCTCVDVVVWLAPRALDCRAGRCAHPGAVGGADVAD